MDGYDFNKCIIVRSDYFIASFIDFSYYKSCIFFGKGKLLIFSDVCIDMIYV